MHFLFLTNIKCNRRHSKVMQSSTLCVFCVFHQRAVLDYILGDICCDGTHLMEAVSMGACATQCARWYQMLEVILIFEYFLGFPC